ncbi:MAG TPA: transcriptional regulator [Actinomycetota bacterium]
MRLPSALRRLRWWRWVVLLAAVAVLVALPALAGALPVPGTGRALPAATLLAKVQGSAAVPYQGYAESRAGLGLPDVPNASGVVALLGETTRMRAWVASPSSWRVDQLTTIGERDLYHDADGTWLWDSGSRDAEETRGEPAVRFVRPADLLPPELGRRLAAAATPAEATRIGGRRIAGVDAAGLRITPRSADTTIARVDLWADPASGLPVRVEVATKGASTPILVSTFLDLRQAAPSPAVAGFQLPADANVEHVDSPDIAQAIDRWSPYVLPDQVGGLPRRTTVAQAAATYGQRFDLVAALAFPDQISWRTRNFLAQLPQRSGPWGQAGMISTPLLNGMIVEQGGVAYVLAGTVTQAALERAATALVHQPLGARP